MADHERAAREMLLDAVARGWLTADQVWEAVGRSQAGEAISGVLDSLLDASRLALLRASSRTVTQVQLSSSIPPPRSSGDGDHLTISEAPVSRGDLGGMPGLSTFERYRTEKMLGRGGAGRVLAARDREIGRVIAIKTLRDGADTDEELVRRFLIEARVTAQLEHPNIVPVYDLGVTPDGAPFYTMRVVEKQSLASVFMSDRLRSEWPLVRMLGAFAQVCRAVAYAHSKGVLHGDIKPENILLGDFGEVYLADWGLTRVQPHSPVRTTRHTSAPPPVHSLLSEVPPPPDGGGEATPRSRPGGTPGYVAPEVVKGDWSQIDHRADLFSLGVVLYEMLTEEQPFAGDSPREIIISTIADAPRRPREIWPGCPLLLEDLCLELLDKEREARPDSADEVAIRIENYLEGAKEKERRREEALKLCDLAEAPARLHWEQEQEGERLRLEARALLDKIEEWQPVDDKREAWAIDDRAEAAEREAALRLAEAIELYTKALGYDADCGRAHEGLADLYWGRAERARRERREPTQIYYEALLREHDTGKYAALLSATARLTLRSTPSASVRIHRYERVERRLVPGGAHLLGHTPIDVPLEPGSYLLVLSAPGHHDVRYPVQAVRGGRHQGDVTLYTAEEIGEGFVHVPAGPFIMGGDPDAYDALPRQEPYIEDFAIAEFPVTVRQYCAFLDSIGGAAAERRAPWNLKEYVGAIVVRDGAGKWVPDPGIIEGEARQLFPPEKGHLWNVPILLVTWFDARAFCRWSSEQTGEVIRLPTEAEWEKAARGVDGRAFPWGDDFDATYCLMRGSRPFPQQPEPIATFPTDESPYGVRDVAGGMREWVGDIHGERSAAELDAEPEPADDIERGESSLRSIRSGGWGMPRDWSRCASRSRIMSLFRGTGLSFRVAKSLPEKR